MKDPRDLIGIDAAWLAIDAEARVAFFFTGGEGPVPDSALQSIESAEEMVLQLPMTSDFQMYFTAPHTDVFTNPAMRGLFVYDWSDVHRTTREALGGYELLAEPTRPLHLSDLPTSLQALAAETCLSEVAFGQRLVVLARAFGT